MVELKLVKIVTKLELEVFTMLRFTVDGKLFLSRLVVLFFCSLCANELQTLVSPKTLPVLLQLK